MNHLRRELAPISDDAWKAIDAEASRSLRHFLAARKVVDFSGPQGWEHSADVIGRTERIDGPVEGVDAAVRSVQPLVELRTPFPLARADLDDIERGRADADLSAVVEAARRAALAEDRTVFHGFKAAGMMGMTDLSPHRRLEISDDYAKYPCTVAQAVDILRTAGVDGPYAAVLGPRCYTGVIESTEYGGYPVLEHIHLILGGPVIWGPGVDGAVVLSRRG
ncbi:MAG TPA: family 1 encapsulin nanocompartment shell protein, partial [Acidimicrobiia bacterium]